MRICGVKPLYLHQNYKRRQFSYFKYEVQISIPFIVGITRIL